MIPHVTPVLSHTIAFVGHRMFTGRKVFEDLTSYAGIP